MKITPFHAYPLGSATSTRLVPVCVWHPSMDFMSPKIIRIITVRQMDRYSRAFPTKSDFKKTIIARYSRNALTMAEVEYLFGKHELWAA